ncbi:MAG: endonuclease [Elusimicrobiales bacterium]|jgi:hypothetical protein
MIRVRLVLISLVCAAAVHVFAAPDAPVPPLQALSGEQLFQRLHNETEAVYQPSGHDYLDAKKFMFSKADNVGCGGAPGVVEFYSRICVQGSSPHGEDYKEQGDQNNDGTVDSHGMNAEHGWPQGYFDRAYPMKSDLHHVFPTFITPNSARAELPFGVVDRAVYATSNGTRKDAKGFEPADSVKGDVARAMLYFVVRYYDREIRSGMRYNDFWISRVPMFLEWNRQDPPDDAERRRNELINQFQGNRNPFVDDPALADKIGEAVFASH